MSNIIRSLMIRVGADLTEAQKNLKQISKDLKTTGKALTSAGDTLTKGLTVPILGAIASLGAMVGKSLEAADSLSQMAEVTGLSAERLQELQFVGTKLDVELETITGSQKFLTKAMLAAQQGAKDQSDIFKELGISVVDSSGNLRDSNVVFQEAIAALGEMENSTERDAMSLKLFGKSAMDLNPLIKAGADEIANLTDEAHASGAVLSNETIGAMDDFGDSLDAAKLSLTAAAGKITTIMLPSLKKLLSDGLKGAISALEKMASVISSVITKFTNMSPWMQKMTGLTVALSVAIGPMLTLVGKFDIALASVASRLAAAAMSGGGLTATLSALAGPAGITVAAIAAITLAVGALTIKYQENNQESIALSNQIKELKQESEASAAAFEEQSKQTGENAELARRLSEELYNLNDKEVKSNVDKARMSTLIKQLNEMYPDLNLAISEETGLLNKSKQATSDLIKEKEKMMLFEIYEERMKKLLIERIDAEDNLAAAIQGVSDAANYYNSVQGSSAEVMALAQANVDSAIQKQKDMEAALRDNQAAYADVSSDYAAMANEIAATNDNVFGNMATDLANVTVDSQDEAYAIGAAIGSGMINGLASKESEAATEAKRIAKLTLKEIRLAADIKSPSKITRGFGQMIAEGLTVGMRERGKNALRQAGQLASGVVNSFRMVGSGSLQSPSYASSSLLTPALASGPAGMSESDVFSAVSKAMQANRNNSTITVPLVVNGREFARATVNDIDRELQTKAQNQSRGGG